MSASQANFGVAASAGFVKGKNLASRRKRGGVAVASCAMAVASLLAPGAHAAVSSTWTNTSGNSLWSNPANWSPNSFYPSNGNGASDYNVTINLGGTVSMDVNVGLDNLTLNNSSGGLTVQGGKTFIINGPTVTNAGIIEVNTNTGATSVLNFNASTTIGGGGSIQLFDSANLAILNTSSGAVLTQSAGHTIDGFGDIYATIINHGTIAGTIGGQTLFVHSAGGITNTGLMEANGGAMVLDNGVAVSNAGGTFAAITNSVTLNAGASISGGTLNSSAGQIFSVNNATLTGITLTTGGQITVAGGGSLNLGGPTVTDNGNIQVNTNSGGTSTLLVNSNTTLTGNGSLTLFDNGNLARLNTSAGVVLTQDTLHTINGFGDIYATIVNNGTISSTIGGQTLFIHSAGGITNNGVIKTAGGSMQFDSGVAVNNSNGVINASSGTVVFTGGTTITGGTLTAVSSGFTAAGATFAPLTIAAPATVTISPGTTLNLSGGNYINNGVIQVNTNSGSTSTLSINANTTMNGSGGVLLDDSANLAIINTAASATLTVGAGQTIHGFGDINAALVNNGTVNADVGGQVIFLQTSANASTGMTNNARLEATSGSLNINAITVTQGAAGNIFANGGPVNIFGGSTIVGGAVQSSAGSIVTVSNTDTFSAVTIPVNSNVYLAGNALLNISGGTLTNNGLIRVDDNGGAPATLNFTTSTLLTGAGNVLLNDSSPRALINTSAGAVVTIDTNQLIHGVGDVNAALINNGTINADISGQTINLQTNNMTNNNLLEATGAGGLNINNITITQGSHGATSGVILANGGNVSLTNGTTIVGGIVQSNGSSGIFTSGTSTFNNVTLPTGTTVFIAGNATLNVSGGTLTNNGTIRVDDNGGAAATLNFTTNSLLTGNGSVQLFDSSPRALLNAASGSVVTVDTNQLIHGTGDVDAAITNFGTINADISGQTINLQTSNMTNDNLMEATGSGGLVINGITVTQSSHNATSGVINAVSGNVSLINNATIVGGSLISTNGSTGIFVGSTSATFTNVNLPTGTSVFVAGGGTLTLTAGTINNNGTIRIDDNGGSVSILSIPGNVTLAGTGTLNLFDNSHDARVVSGAGATLTIGTSQSVVGYGDIDASLINNGLINANTNGQYINFFTSPNASTGVTNTTTIEATNSGNISVNSITLTQAAGATLSAAAGSRIDLNSANVSGGILSTTGNGIIYSFNSILSGGPTIAAGANVQVPGSNSLTVLGPTLTNNGTIQVQTNAGGISFLNFNTSTTVAGTGTIFLDDNATDARLTTATGATLTIASGQTINGFGDIDAVMINNGLINANTGGQTINLNASPNGSSGVTNNSVIEATNSGNLAINGIMLTQSAAASLNAASGSVVNLNAANISGGILSGVSGATFNSFDSILSNSPTLTAGTFLQVPAGHSLTVLGPTLTNNGTIQVQTDSGGVSFLNFNTSTSVAGTGAIVLDDNATDARLTTATGATVTIASGQTINGFGDIDAVLINNGLINASISGQTINLNASPNGSSGITNNSIIEATGSGNLAINGITLTQSPTASVNAASGSVVNLNAANISGGILSGVSGATFNSFDSILSGSPTLTAGTFLQVPAGHSLTVLGPTFTNNGTIQVQTNSGGVSFLNFNTSTNVVGTGTIVLDDNASDARLTTAVGATVTIGASQTINGFGDINAVIVNNGTINASVSGQLLNLNGTTTGTGNFQASGGGTLNVNGTLTITAPGSLVGAGAGSTILVSNGATVIDNGSVTGLPAITDNGILTFAANPNTGILVRSLNSLTLGGTGTATVTSASNLSNRTLLTTSTLNFAGGTGGWSGQLNLGNNDMDVTAGNLSNITDQIKQGYHGGKWNGPGGIVSSVAAADTTHLTALGSIQNNQGGAPLYTASNKFDGITPGAGDILVKYTYYGDANLDGKVDGSDYTRIDNGFLTHGVGWFNGDFNYDGVINGSDYTLIDNAFNTQGAALAAQIADPTATIAAQIVGGSSIPEPASLGLIGLTSLAALSRRRRR